MADIVKMALAGEGGQGVQSIAEILAEAANARGKQALYIPNFGVEQRGGVSIAFVQIGDHRIGAPKFQYADILVALSPRAVRRTRMYAGRDTIYIYDNSLVQEGEVNDNIIGLQYYDVNPPCPAAAEPRPAVAPDTTVARPNADLPQSMIAGEPKTCSFTKQGAGIDPAEVPAHVRRIIPIPANDIAKNELQPRVFNMLILGALIAVTDILPLSAIKDALDERLGEKFKANPQLRDLNFRALARGYELIGASVFAGRRGAMSKVAWQAAHYENKRGHWHIFPGLCKGCGLCIEKCPVKCIGWADELGVYGTPRVAADMDKCIVCGICQMVCPDCAIRVEKSAAKV